MQILYKKINTDLHGYLINPKDWNENIAKKISKIEGILLSKEHWEIIYFIRKFYFKYNTTPAIRMLVKAIKKKYGKKKGNSIYLLQLFPNGPAQQATKIAGLPKPVKCL